MIAQRMGSATTAIAKATSRAIAAPIAIARTHPLALSAAVRATPLHHRTLSSFVAPRAASSSSSSSPSSSRTTSALATDADRVELEFAGSGARRSQHAARLAELRALEAQLHAHRQAESMSLAWHARLHWSKHGPVIAAVLCTMASMSAAYQLWQTTHFYTLDHAKLQTEAASSRAQIEDIERRQTMEHQETHRILKAYADSKVGRAPRPLSALVSRRSALFADTLLSCLLCLSCLCWSFSRPHSSPLSPPLPSLQPRKNTAHPKRRSRNSHSCRQISSKRTRQARRAEPCAHASIKTQTFSSHSNFHQVREFEAELTCMAKGRQR